jgi:hypothetical protein
MYTQIAWGAQVGGAFITRLVAIAHGFNWYADGPSDLMSCMAFESGETFSPTIRNAAGSGAIGLIQFMPSTAQSLGTSTSALAAMTAVEQLDYVEKYFRPYAPRIKSLPDMYMAILLPKYVGQPDDSALFNEGTVAYRQNSGLDVNSDGIITKAEAASLVASKKRKGLLPPRVLTGQW